MKKYTRKHYNKKLIAFGLCLFMGIGITSTGFAAWVMSRDADEQASDGVNVAIIEDASVGITLWELDELGNILTKKLDETSETVTRVELTVKNDKGAYVLGDNFSFDAKADDNAGRLRASEGSVEDLKVTVKGTLDTHDVDYDLTAKLVLPDTIKAAIDAGYLDLLNDDLLSENGATVTVDQNGDFTVVLEFAWGTMFNGMNPCEYYDLDMDGKAVSNEDMELQMIEFRKVMTGIEDNAETSENEILKTTYSGAFTLTLSATPSVVEEDPE